jgi:hypothetical protein
MRRRKAALIIVGILTIGMVLGTGVALADRPTEFDQRGNETSWENSNAFDEWGYNYNGHVFSGPYCFYDRHHPGDSNDEYCDIDLIMKWSDEWLNKDRVRCAGTPQQGSSACEGAWLTNHQRGTNPDGSHWSYFVKIVYPPGGPVDVDPADGYDDNTGGEIIWGAYIIIQQVSNDPSVGEHGVLSLVKPAGFGAY